MVPARNLPPGFLLILTHRPDEPADQCTPAAIAAALFCMSVFAFGEAWRQYGRAFEGHRRSSSDDAELMMAAAEAARWDGAVTSAIELVQRALDVAKEATMRARLHERLAQYLWNAGRTDEARAAFVDAAEHLDRLQECRCRRRLRRR